MKKIPKRPHIPFLTDLLEYKQAARNTIPYTKKMVEKYGDVCDVSFTGVKNFFIHDPEVIKEMLTIKGGKMKRSYLFKAFRQFLGNGLVTADGQHHRKQRKLIKPVFYPERVKGYASIMSRCACDEIESWQEGKEINVTEAMTSITLKVITRCMFSSGLEATEISAIGSDLKLSFDTLMNIVANPIYAYCLINNIRIPIVRKFYRQKRKLTVVIDRIISTYRNGIQQGNEDLLSLLLEAQDETTGEYMSDEEIRDEVLTFFLAGHETTALALTWTLYLLGRHPEIKNKFMAEIDSVIADKIPSSEHYELLPYTKNILKESLRLYPPAWTIARETAEDVELAGYHFPKGAVLWTITYLLHRDEKYFPESEKFLPERWDSAYVKTIPKYAYFPFGGGNRMCIGEGFAWMEAMLVLAAIGSRCTFEIPDETDVPVNPMFTLRPKSDILMSITKRLPGQ